MSDRPPRKRPSGPKQTKAPSSMKVVISTVAVFLVVLALFSLIVVYLYRAPSQL